MWFYIHSAKNQVDKPQLEISMTKKLNSNMFKLWREWAIRNP